MSENGIPLKQKARRFLCSEIIVQSKQHATMYGGYDPRHVTMKFKPDGNLSPTHYGLNVYQIDAWDLLVNCHSHSLMRPLAERHAV